jgi:hypothetical protein
MSILDDDPKEEAVPFLIYNQTSKGIKMFINNIT